MANGNNNNNNNNDKENIYKYDPSDKIKLYEEATQQSKQLLDKSLQGLGRREELGLANIQDIYSEARTGAQTQAELDRQRQAETLANIGLGKASYQAPTSGVSETSRIYQDVALQRQLGQLGIKETNAISALRNAIDTQRQKVETAKLQEEQRLQQQISQTQLQAKDINQQRQVQILNNANTALQRGQVIDQDSMKLYEELTGRNYLEELKRTNYGAYKTYEYKENFNQKIDDPNISNNAKNIISKYYETNPLESTDENIVANASYEILNNFINENINEIDIEKISELYGKQNVINSISSLNEVLSQLANTKDEFQAQNIATFNSIFGNKEKIKELGKKLGINIEFEHIEKDKEKKDKEEKEKKSKKSSVGENIKSILKSNWYSKKHW